MIELAHLVLDENEYKNGKGNESKGYWQGPVEIQSNTDQQRQKAINDNCYFVLFVSVNFVAESEFD